MAVEAVALLQAGLLLPPCIPTPKITTPNPLISFPTGLLSEAVEAASAVISRNPHLAIMFQTLNPFAVLSSSSLLKTWP